MKHGLLGRALGALWYDPVKQNISFKKKEYLSACFSLKLFGEFRSFCCWCLKLQLNLGPGFRLRTMKEFNDTKAELSNTNTSMLDKAECPSRRVGMMRIESLSPGCSTLAGPWPSQGFSLGCDGVVGPIVNSV